MTESMSMGGNAKVQLRSIVERVERLEEEKAGLAADIRDVYAEAKGHGFDVKALRAVVRLRRQNQAEREEHEATVDLYMVALYPGEQPTPQRGEESTAE